VSRVLTQENGIKFRHHRRFLDEALETTIFVKDKAELENILGDKLRITKYGEGIDERCGWDTYIVTDDLPAGKNKCVYGFTDGPLS
jgi:hypothetical protein